MAHDGLRLQRVIMGEAAPLNLLLDGLSIQSGGILGSAISMASSEAFIMIASRLVLRR